MTIVQHVRPVDFAAFKPSEFHSQFIADAKSGVDSCLLICTRVPAGKGTSAGLHVHVADQFYYILRGQMQVQIGSAQYTANPGNLFFIPAGAPHWNWNDGDEDEVHAELIVPAPSHGQPTVYAVQVPSLTASPAEDDFYVRPLDESRFDPEDFSVVTLADRTTGSRSCRINLLQVPPGKQSPGLHVHSFDQFYYVLSGTMTLQIGLETQTVGPNSYVVLPAGTPHCNWNEGPAVERHLAILVPEMLPAPEADLPVTLG
jgi:mannose-6-phosphate isomerase-like protein (cupin superfamily)